MHSRSSPGTSVLLLAFSLLLACRSLSERPPGQPVIISVKALPGAVEVRWAAASPGSGTIQGYTVTAQPGGATVTTTDLVAVVEGLRNGTSYTFTVRATNEYGAGPESRPSQAVTPVTVPGAPSNVSATPKARSAVVTWTAPDNGGKAITQYRVEATPGNFSTTTTTTSATITDLPNNATFTFKVTARNTVGEGPPSEPSNAITTPDLPGVPRNVQGTAGNNEVTLTWEPPTSNGGLPIIRYDIRKRGDTTILNWVTGTSATIANLTNGSAYEFEVRAANDVGTGPFSDPSPTLTPRALPSAPRAVSAQANIRSATVTWLPPFSNGGSAISHYTLTTNPGGTTTTATTSPVTITGLQDGVTYTFTVRATNAVGDGPESSPSSPITLPKPPGAPTGVTVHGGNCGVALGWLAPADDGGHPITRYEISGTPGDIALTVPGSETQAVLPQVPVGIEHTFTLRAVNAVGQGIASASVKTVVPKCVQPQLPGAPMHLLADSPYAVAPGDFDGDGKQDLALGTLSGSLLVTRSNGNGTFGAPTRYEAGAVTNLVTGDFNGDGRLDIAATNVNDSTVGIYLGNGSGGFLPQVKHLLGGTGEPYGLAAGDFDGNGSLDLVAANFGGSGTVSVLLNNGNGTFAEPVSYATAAGSFAVAVGDLTGDGKLDLTVANHYNDTVTVLTNGGDGTFTTPLKYAAGDGPAGVALADLDGNGTLDVAVTNYNVQSVSVLLNDGTGKLGLPTSQTVIPLPKAVRAADLEGDGRPELVCAGSAPAASVLRNKGNGTFNPQVLHPAGYEVTALAVGDFDGNGRPDVVTTGGQSGLGSAFTVMMNDGAGALLAPMLRASGGRPTAVATGDLDGDGAVDIAVTSSTNNTVGVYLASGTGYSSQLMFGVGGGSPTHLALGDLDGDGKLDLVAVKPASNALSVLRNTSGSGNLFGAAVDYPTGTQPQAVVVKDLNGDGKLDLAVANAGSDTVGVLLNTGNGTFAAQVTHPAGSGPEDLVAEDFDADGKPDLATLDPAMKKILVLRGRGDGTFDAPVTFDVGSSAVTLAAGDVNGDGKRDLVIGNAGIRTVSILLGKGDGTFSPRIIVPSIMDVQVVGLGDLDGDGRPDLMVANGQGDVVRVLLGNGDGTFSPGLPYAAGPGVTALAIADLDVNNRPDVVTANANDYSVSVLRNRGALQAASSIPRHRAYMLRGDR